MVYASFSQTMAIRDRNFKEMDQSILRDWSGPVLRSNALNLDRAGDEC